MSYIINDFVDLTRVEKVVFDNGEIVERKVAITKDQFYSERPRTNTRQIPNTNDSSSASVSTSPNKNRYFGIVSTSDKEINYRLYDFESWKKTVTDGTWVGNPYAKPILRHHDLYYGDSVGRFKDTFFYDNSNGATISTSGKPLPKEAIDYFKSRKCFDKGTGTVIAEFIPDEYTADRIDRGLDVTLSQSSVMDKLICGVCGKDYYGRECTHMAGRTYEVEKDGVSKNVKCLVRAYDYSPVELSLVNHPANDVSIIFVMKPKDNTSNDSSSKIEPQIDGNTVISENSEVNDNKESKSMEVQNLFKKIAKDHFKAQLREKFEDSEEIMTSFDSLFELLTEEQIENFSDFIQKLEPKKTEDTTEVPETTENTEAPEVPEAPKTTDNTEVPEVPEAPKAPETTENTSTDGEITPEVKPVEAPTTTDNEETGKEKNLKTVFKSDDSKKVTDIKDKEILAYLENYKF